MKHRIVFLIAAIVCGVWCAAAQNKHAGHEWVDLGLPSGTKWATCNVGASTPEDYGNYYAWGETKPKTTYSWDTYKWVNFHEEPLLKYNTSSSYGTMDNKTVLDPADDAARAAWGGSWRMPTEAEWTELRENCEWTWTTRNGVNGYEVKGTNGNSIFLPAAGYRYGDDRDYAFYNGYYWSSSLYTDYPYNAWSVNFNSYYVSRGRYSRYYGRSVRPVLFVREAEEKAHITEQEKTVGAQNKHAGHNYVDLGLSVKWATCNVGATKPEEYGNYYAWGETTPKDYYDWNTYKWATATYDARHWSLETLTKYCTKSSDGRVDNKTVLDPADDAARANWGGAWRMPTDAEWTELREKCTWTWTTLNGVNGYEVEGTNGNSIFLPAASFRVSDDLYNAGSGGYYWSSSLGTDYPSSAWKVYFLSVDVYRRSSNRSYGQSVRPVLFVREAEEKAHITEQEKTVGAQNKHAGHNYVDLGLSVKWATCNVGATSPGEYGNYYAWGETEPKTTYDWSTYKLCNGSKTTLTKYCTKSSYGTVDNDTVLDLTDDAARVNWGGAWRMPTDAEWTELRENCEWTWTTRDGVNGYEVKGTNGNSIFLPAAGLRDGGDLGYAGLYGYYWSSSLHTGYPSGAWSVYFGSGGVLRGGTYRYYGQSVRPVFK